VNADRLSRAVSAHLRLLRDEAAMYENLALFGGHDCGPIAQRGIDRERAATLATLGYTERSLRDEVVARTSEAVAHRLGL